MRFWSITLLVAALLLLLYSATYLTVPHTSEPTTSVSLERESSEDQPAETPLGEIIDVGPAKLELFLKRKDDPVIVDFWAAWCGPCKILDPTLESLASQFAGRATFLRVDFDEHYELARRYEITAVPTVLIFTDGREMERYEGVTSEPVLRESIQRAGANEELAEFASHGSVIAFAGND